MKVLKVPLKETERVRRLLVKEELIDHGYRFAKDKEFFYFPITKAKKIVGTEIVNKKLEEQEQKETDLKEALKYYLTKDELKLLKTSYDTVGNIAIIEVQHELEPKETIIAEQLMKLNPSITTVVKKKGIHSGEYRTQETEYLAGKKTKTTLHKENGVTLKINIDKTYFSVRLSTERKRIAEMVKPKENILVMFSGAAPYPLVLAKNTEASTIIGIEINPDAHKLGLENIVLNKAKNVTLINGDVKEEVPKLKQKYDRILMPLPKTADEFLPIALSVAKSGTIIHFYDFQKEDEFKLANDKIQKACKEVGFKYRILRTVRCGQHAPHIFRICVDFKIL
jgi:tRNA (guanine37-N1)-methyltransferase